MAAIRGGGFDFQFPPFQEVPADQAHLLSMPRKHKYFHLTP
jgi:hypothetical protein